MRHAQGDSFGGMEHLPVWLQYLAAGPPRGASCTWRCGASSTLRPACLHASSHSSDTTSCLQVERSEASTRSFSDGGGLPEPPCGFSAASIASTTTCVQLGLRFGVYLLTAFAACRQGGQQQQAVIHALHMRRRSQRRNNACKRANAFPPPV